MKDIARLRRVENHEKLKKEGLIITLLKSESNAAEQNFKKLFNSNTNDDTSDDKIRGKISDIRMTLSRLGNIVTINDRKNILHNRQGQFSGTHDLILALKSFTDCNFLHSSGKIFHNLGPQYDKDSDPYRTVFIRRVPKSEVFLRSYS